MNIAEIKKRHSKESAIYLYCKDGDSEESEVTSDVSYLLTIIKNTENELNKIYSLANGLNANEVIIRQKAEEALKSIQGEE